MAIYHTRTTNNLINALKLLLENMYCRIQKQGGHWNKLKDCLDDNAATVMLSIDYKPTVSGAL